LAKFKTHFLNVQWSVRSVTKIKQIRFENGRKNNYLLLSCCHFELLNTQLALSSIEGESG